MDAHEFIEFAGKLAQQASNGPSCMRSSVSRAYYGAYHLAHAFLARSGWFCTNDNEHLWVYLHFYNCKTSIAKQVGIQLGNLRESRKESDYDLSETSAETQANAIVCVQRAANIQSLLLQCEAVSALAVIRGEMIAYRKIQRWPT